MTLMTPARKYVTLCVSDVIDILDVFPPLKSTFLVQAASTSATSLLELFLGGARGTSHHHDGLCQPSLFNHRRRSDRRYQQILSNNSCASKYSRCVPYFRFDINHPSTQSEGKSNEAQNRYFGTPTMTSVTDPADGIDASPSM